MTCVRSKIYSIKPYMSQGFNSILQILVHRRNVNSQGNVQCQKQNLRIKKIL